MELQMQQAVQREEYLKADGLKGQIHALKQEEASIVNELNQEQASLAGELLLVMERLGIGEAGHAGGAGAPQLLPGWSAHLHEGKTYYWHAPTGKSQWEPPTAPSWAPAPVP